MNGRRIMGPACAIALLAACGGEDPEATPPPATAQDPPPAALPAPAPERSALDFRPEEGIAVDTLVGGGLFLTDADGRALYLKRGEPQKKSTCHDECARAWPPFRVPPGRPPSLLAPAVQPVLIGTIEREDGTTQVTYGGKALYYSSLDAGPGTAMGYERKDDWGRWSLVSPEGGRLLTPEEEAERRKAELAGEG